MENSRRHDLAPALLLAALTAVALPALGLRLPAPGQPVALLLGPSVAAQEAMRRVAALDGRLVADGGVAGVVVAVFDYEIGIRRLWRNGVWASFDPAFAVGCAVATADPSASVQGV